MLHTTPLHYATLSYTTLKCTTLHYTTRRDTNYNDSYNYNYATLHFATLDYATLRYTNLHYITLHSLHHRNCNCNYLTPHRNYNATILQLQLQLHYTTLHPAVVGEVTDQVTTATIVTTRKTQLQPPFSPSVDSLCHPWFTTTKLSYRFPILKLPPPSCAVVLLFHEFSINIPINIPWIFHEYPLHPYCHGIPPIVAIQ